MAVATAALFVSFGGVSYGLATGSIGSREIENGSIQGKDVGKRQIDGVKLKSVGGKAVNEGALQALKIHKVRFARNADTLNGKTADQISGSGSQGPAGPQGPAGQNAFVDVGVATAGAFDLMATTAYTDVPGMTTTVTVPAGSTATVIAKFSAESTCFNGTFGDWCSVRVLLDGTEMTPAGGKDSAFDSTADGGIASFEHNALVRSETGVGPGTHTIKVQTAGVDGPPDPGPNPPDVRLDDLSLVIEAIGE